MPPLPCPAPDECLLWLVRHAATENNLAQPPRLQGQRLDPPLSATGRNEAAQAANWLASGMFAAVYSSPLRRAVETAESIAMACRTSVTPVDALIECDIGRWEGRTWAEIAADDAEALARFEEDAGHWPYAGGENLTEVARRALPAVTELAVRHVGQSIVAVAHNVVNRVLIADMIGIPLRFTRRIPQHNCGINLLQFRSGRWTVLTINAVSPIRAG